MVAQLSAYRTHCQRGGICSAARTCSGGKINQHVDAVAAAGGLHFVECPADAVKTSCQTVNVVQPFTFLGPAKGDVGSLLRLRPRRLHCHKCQARMPDIHIRRLPRHFYWSAAIATTLLHRYRTRCGSGETGSKGR